MTRFSTHIIGFNRGLMSKLGLSRIDLKRTAFSAETYENWIARTLGSMMLRPGLKYIAGSLDNAPPRYLPFIFSSTDTAIVELTNLKMRVLVNETPVSRLAVSTVVTNGNFDTDLAGWTDADESGGASTWDSGRMRLLGDGVNAAIRTQALTIAGGDINVEHALNISVVRGTVLIRVGSSDGADDYLLEAALAPGQHSLAFTPTAGTAYLRLFNRNDYPVYVDSAAIASAGDMVLTTQWETADFDNLRSVQSGDVIFIAGKDVIQQRIERRSASSWSVVEYETFDGPYRPINITPIRMYTDALSGAATLTATKAFFKPTNVGSLFKLSSIGQFVSSTLSAADTFTDPILITGIGAARSFSITIAGTWVGTVTLQRAVESPESWEDYKAWTTNTSYSEVDGLDNQIMYYRLGFKVGQYTSGSVDLTMQFSAGSISGVIKLHTYTSSTVMQGDILVNMGGQGATSSTDDWEEGAWSARRGYPTAVTLHEGRLWWAGKDHIYGSVSDAFSSFDSDIEGDSGPISRSIGQGPVDTINWLMSAGRLIIGGQGAEYSVQSSQIDEPLTPTSFTIKAVSNLGSKGVSALNLDGAVIFVQRGGSRVYEMAQRDQYSGYVTNDITSIVPEIGKPGIVKVDAQRQLDARIHCVRSDGTVAILVYDEAEQVRCWVNFTTDGLVTGVLVIPGDIDADEDKVYYTVKRTIGGVDKYYLEKWALESECQGGLVNKQADSHVIYVGAPITHITGLDHLEGKNVVAWADGKDAGLYTVSGGAIDLTVAAANVTVGLGYAAKFKSSKLAYESGMGTPLTQKKRVDHIGVILHNTHNKGLKYGRDFDHLDDLPDIIKGELLASDTLLADHDDSSFEFSGAWDTDSRVCLQATAPRPCTVLALIISLVQHEKL